MKHGISNEFSLIFEVTIKMNYICCLIILKIEHAPKGHLEVIFEGCSTNEDAIVFSWSSVEGVGYYCWL
jgi:hypothetical protein